MTSRETSHKQRRRAGSNTCSLCPKKRTNPHYAYCRECKNAYMRKWRIGRPMTQEQILRDRARSHASVYLKRGKIAKQPCKKCGSPKSEMHHSDYSKPLKITWLCRQHHLETHGRSRAKALPNG